MPSGPVALWMFKPFSNFLTPVDTVMGSIDVNVEEHLSLMVVVSSFLLNNYENCSLRMFALFTLVEYITPVFTFNGETPQLSHLLQLMNPQNFFGFIVDSGIMLLLMYSLQACLQTVLVAFSVTDIAENYEASLFFWPW